MWAYRPRHHEKWIRPGILIKTKGLVVLVTPQCAPRGPQIWMCKPLYSPSHVPPELWVPTTYRTWKQSPLRSEYKRTTRASILGAGVLSLRPLPPGKPGIVSLGVWVSGQQPMQELDVDSPLLQSSDTALGRQAVSMETESAVPSGLWMDTQNR